MITAKHLLDLQRQEPFRAFKLHMSDGREIPITHPETMFVYRSSVVVATPGEDEIGERYSILHITSLQGIETKSHAGNS